MAKAIETFSIKLEFKDAGTQQIITKLSSSLKGMTSVVTGNTSPAISKLRKEILSVGQAGTKSISSFKNQRTALAALRDEARIGSATFKKLTEDIKKLDAQMAKAKPSAGRGGLGARATTQIAGAVVSGGIFGGPEGAIGALGGAALGGVQGAFAGAAIGAQLKGIRDLTSAAAEYAADIEKLEIALKGVAGSQADYSSAIEAAQDATERFNVPQRDAIRGVTRLAAAVKGAGGPIEDAELTFKNVTAAIKATGGSTEDVRGAITAMVQVFSKGKVSAEELSGQLGERLPGAVTKFAEANDMTLPELQKNLKAGTVGLNELMNFIVALGDTYTGTAEKIANSNAEAGARLTVVIQNMQAEIGEALVPIGAQFQAAFAEFITKITPFLVDNVPKIAKLFLTLAKNLDTVLVAATAAFAVFAPAKLAAMVANVGGISAAVGVLKGKLVALGLANPFTALGIAAAGLAGFIHNAAKEQARFNDLLKKGTTAQIDAELTKERLALDESLEKELQAKQAPKGPYGSDFTGIDLAAAEAGTQIIRDRIEALEQARAAVTDTRPTQGAALESYNFKRFQYDPVKPDGEGTTSGATDDIANRIKAAQALERAQIARLNLAQSEGKISQLLAKQLNEREKLQAKINDITEKGTNAEIDKSIAAAQTTQATRQQVELQKAIEGLYEKAKKPIEDIVLRVKEQVELDRQRKKLLAEGVNPEIAEEIINITKARDAALRKFDAEILNLEAKAQQADLSEKELQIIEDQINALRRKKEAITGDAAGAITDVRGTQEEASFTKELTKAIEEQEEALKNLIDPINQVKSAAEAMGEAFSVSFKGLIDGSMTGKEAMASFFQSISDSFMDMAAEIAKEAIKLAALKFVQFIFNSFSGGFGGGGGGGGYSIPDAAVPKTSGIKFFSKGGAFASNKIVPYAKGGIVDKPSLFQYANGGAGNFGLMGEAGPEAIMPLRRGPDGRLGVQASGGVGDIIVNVDAQGSSAQADQPNAKALGSAIGVAVQAELIKQKRPGGLLS